MSWVGAAIAGGTVIGSLISADASGNAADAQVSAANQADATQRYMFDQSTKLSQPWRDAGEETLGTMRTGLQPGGQFSRMFTMDDFQADPGYGFRLGEGQKALERSAAARGGLLSGRTGKALIRYGQDAASTEYGNAYNRFNADRDRLYNRLAAVSGLGQTASRDVSQNAMTLGTNIGNNTMAAGNARASGYVGGANAITGGIGSGLSAYQSQQMINNFRPRYTMGDYPQVQPSVPGQFNLDTYG